MECLHPIPSLRAQENTVEEGVERPNVLGCLSVHVSEQLFLRSKSASGRFYSDKQKQHCPLRTKGHLAPSLLKAEPGFHLHPWSPACHHHLWSPAFYASVLPMVSVWRVVFPGSWCLVQRYAPRYGGILFEISCSK